MHVRAVPAPPRSRASAAASEHATVAEHASAVGSEGASFRSMKINEIVQLLQQSGGDLSYNDRFTLLRLINEYLSTKKNRSMSVKERQTLNQLILDNALYIILNEDRVSSLTRRQMMRTECILILASVVDSSNLFGDTKRNVDALLSNEQQASPSPRKKAAKSALLQELDLDAESYYFPRQSVSAQGQSPSKQQQQSPSKRPMDSPGSLASRQSVSAQGSRRSPAPADKENESPNGSPERRGGLVSSASAARLAPSPSSRNRKGTLFAWDDRRVIKSTVLSKAPKIMNKSYMKPRPSVIFGDTVESDAFVPGVDSLDFARQDRRLGYQKPRMWFPQLQAPTGASLLPAARGHRSTGPSAADEYLQMRALLSYVGDLVLPSAGRSCEGGVSKRMAGTTTAARYDQAVREAVQLWRPLIGATLPSWARGRRSALPAAPAAAPAAAPDDASALSEASSSSSQVRRQLEHSVLFTKGVLRKLLRQEIVHATALSSQGVRARLDALLGSDGLDLDELRGYQGKLALTLDAQRSVLDRSKVSIDSLMLQSLQLAYAQLPERYLVALEGKDAKGRGVLARFVERLCARWRRDLLRLALGIWKISLIEAESARRRPLYARRAAVQLMASWFSGLRARNLRVWVDRWRSGVARELCLERDRTVLPIQSAVRRSQAYKRFVERHRAGPYNGPLSDVYLARDRGIRPLAPAPDPPSPPLGALPFKIPEWMRNERRAFWLAPIPLQSQWRAYALYRVYWQKRRKVIKAQACARMWPLYRQFRYFKHVVIRAQSWARRTIKRNRFVLERRSAWMVQKYVRRYINILWHLRRVQSVWRPAEERLEPVVAIQCRWRITLARRLVLARALYRQRRLWATLLTQRNWYRLRGASVTFFLMAAYRAREVEDQLALADEKAATREDAARALQRYYKRRFRLNVVRAAVRLQTWYRVRFYRVQTARRRRQAWASRKLRALVRVRVHRIVRLARRLQNWWMWVKPGVRRRELRRRAAARDAALERLLSERCYSAACAMQAFVKGVNLRYWLRRDRAARRIQRMVKRFVCHMIWKDTKRKRYRKGIALTVKKMLLRSVEEQAQKTVAYHASLVRRPQALLRGALLRCQLARSRLYAVKLARAVILIQRCWRRSGAVQEAVAALVAQQYRDSSPFRRCSCMHQVIVSLVKETSAFYSPADPRAGLRIGSLLRRLCASALLDMFTSAKKKYSHASDLVGITMADLNILHKSWVRAKMKKERQKKDSKKAAAPPSSPGKKADKSRGPPEAAPRDLFKTLVRACCPVLVAHPSKHRDAVMALASVQETHTPQQLRDFVIKTFINRFGAQQRSRAENVADKIAALCWSPEGGWANYRHLGHHALTTHQVAAAVNTAHDSSRVFETLAASRTGDSGGSGEVVLDPDLKRDSERAKQSLALLQRATERMLELCSPGTLRDTLLETAQRAADYKRKFAFHLERRHQEASPTSSAPGQTLTVDDWIERRYSGPLHLAEHELTLSLCKLHFEPLYRLAVATKGIDTLKRRFRTGVVWRLRRRADLDSFLSRAREAYLFDTRGAHVVAVWKKEQFRREVERKIQLVYEETQAKIALVKGVLSGICRADWAEFPDEGTGLPTWVHKTTFVTVSEMPIYSYDEYLHALQLQKAARAFLKRSRERRARKAEERARRLRELSLSSEQETRASLKHVSFSINVVGRTVAQALAEGGGTSAEAADLAAAYEALEKLLPFHLRVMHNPRLHPGRWALKTGPLPHAFESVRLFNVRSVASGELSSAAGGGQARAKRQVDCKDRKGCVSKGVAHADIFDMNFLRGDVVEAVERRTQYFFRATIQRVSDCPHVLGQKIYDVAYESGKSAMGLTREEIRPTPELLQAFARGRRARLVLLQKEVQRREHFRQERARRALGSRHKAGAVQVEFSRRWRSTAPPAEPKEDGSKEEAASGKKPAKGRPQSDQTAPGQAFAAMQRARQSLCSLTAVAKSNIVYVKKVLRFGWKSLSLDGGKVRPDNVVYRNTLATERLSSRASFSAAAATTTTPPYYDALDQYAAAKIQSVIKLKQTANSIRALLRRETLEEIARGAVASYQKKAFVGYGSEGVTALQLLRRAGYYDVADAVEGFFVKARRSRELSDMKIDALVKLAPDKYSSYGIEAYGTVKSMSDFSKWYRANVGDKKKMWEQLSFVNAFSGADDDRPWAKCIRDSEQAILAKFLRYFPAQASRTKAAVEEIVCTSLFPLTHMQIDVFFRKYKDKAELARANVGELINKATTSTWVEEAKAYSILRFEARRIRVLLGNLQLRTLRDRVQAALDRADQLLVDARLASAEAARAREEAGSASDSEEEGEGEGEAEAPKKVNGRSLCPGVEGRAAYIIRSSVLQYVLDASRACELIQRHLRRFSKQSVYRRISYARKVATVKIQNLSRSRAARAEAAHLRSQQQAAWEQLWDAKRGVMYYYHRETKSSVYTEPRVVYRPLVRDRLSARLVQAWPFLDATRVATTRPLVDESTCCICHDRRGTKQCLGCLEAGAPYLFCFSCHAKKHAGSEPLASHHFIPTSGIQRPGAAADGLGVVLVCLSCHEPATRRCCGLLGEAQLEAAADLLLRSPPSEWRQALRQLVGPRKVEALLLSLQQLTQGAGSEADALVRSHGQQIRVLLERSRVECDDCYCADCYAAAHQGGRARHRWTGFRPYSQACSVCAKAPADSVCAPCGGSAYCASCFRVFHSRGRKRRHRKEALLERLEGADGSYCRLCQRRQATEQCPHERCGDTACDACMHCDHSLQCKFKPIEEGQVGFRVAAAHAVGGEDGGEGAAAPRAPLAERPVSSLALEDLVCAGCGRAATVKCLQCGDFYCSEVWMGNPGCFANFHSRGSRARHKQQEVRSVVEQAVRSRAELAAARSSFAAEEATRLRRSSLAAKM